MKDNNKNNYFKVTIEIAPLTRQSIMAPDKLIEKYENVFEPVLQRLNTSDVYTIYRKTELAKVTFLLKTNERKRIGLLRNQINKHLDPFN